MWRYQAIEKRSDEDVWVDIHEVYLDEDDKIHSWTVDPITFTSDSKMSMVGMLECAKSDVLLYGILHIENLERVADDQRDYMKQWILNGGKDELHNET